MAVTDISVSTASGIARDRVTIERKELEARIAALSELAGSERFKSHDSHERALVFDQIECMQKYSLILAKRLLLY